MWNLVIYLPEVKPGKETRSCDGKGVRVGVCGRGWELMVEVCDQNENKINLF